MPYAYKKKLDCREKYELMLYSSILFLCHNEYTFLARQRNALVPVRQCNISMGSIAELKCHVPVM